MKRYLYMLALGIGLMVAMPVSAHVVVKPAEVGVGAWQTFTMGVPVEKEVSTTGLRLVIPQGMSYVTPNVKPGWTIEVKKEGTGEEARVTEVIWSGGSIPAGQRDDFMFSAKVPPEASTIQWKAYQTYADGTIVAWDKTPSEEKEQVPNTGPYSETKVVNDLAANTEVKTVTEEAMVKTGSKTLEYASFAMSILALGLAGYTFGKMKK